MTTPDLLTARQAAVLLGVSKRTVHREAHDKLLPVAYTFPTSGAMLFRQQDVVARANARAATDVA